MAITPWPPVLGETHKADGFFGKLRWLVNKPADELEQRIGYGSGRLSQGWWLLLLMEPIGPDDFEFAGHSHLSGGRIGHPRLGNGRVTAHDDLRGILSPEGFRRQQQNLATSFTTAGVDRVAKIVPRSGDDGAYPPGTGIPQWRLLVPKSFIVAASVPAGHKYLGGGAGFWVDPHVAQRFGHPA